MEARDGLRASVLIYSHEDHACFNDQIIVRPALQFEADGCSANLHIVHEEIDDMSLMNGPYEADFAELQRDHQFLTGVTVCEYRSGFIHPRHHVAAEQRTAQPDIQRLAELRRDVNARYAVRRRFSVVLTHLSSIILPIPEYSGVVIR